MLLVRFKETKQGNKYIIVFNDYLTRWPEAFAVPTIDAPVIADLFVKEIMGNHGAPRVLLSEIEAQNFFLNSCLKFFVSSTMRKYIQLPSILSVMASQNE